AWLARKEAFLLGTTPGVLDGRSYPAAGVNSGTSPRFHTMALFKASKQERPERVSWARLHGVALLVVPGPLPDTGVRLLARAGPPEAPSLFYAVNHPAPLAWWPERVESAPSPRGVFDRVV